MVERSFSFLLLISFIAVLAYAPASAADRTSSGLRSVEFTYQVTLEDAPSGAGAIELWIPLPQSTAHQKVSEVRVECNGTYEIGTEDQYGNSFVHASFSQAKPAPELTAVFRVARSLRKGLEATNAEDHHDSDSLEQYLAATPMMPTTGPVATEASLMITYEMDPIIIARKLYKNIVKTVRYDTTGEGWGRGDAVYAHNERAGNCTDFHALFVAHARSVEIPARFLMGFPLPPDKRKGTIAGYHCWAEFYAPDHGWVPVDASEAWKHPEMREFLFGNLDAHRVQFTVGRDIKLPGMKGKPLNYFIYPYAEIDGSPHGTLRTEYRFRDL